MVHDWSASRRSFFIDSWDANSSDFWGLLKDTANELLWICVCSVRAFLDASCLVTNSVRCLLGSNSASRVRSEVLDLSNAAAALVWILHGFSLHVIEDNSSDITKGFIALPFNVLNTLVHAVLGREEAPSAIL